MSTWSQRKTGSDQKYFICLKKFSATLHSSVKTEKQCNKKSDDGSQCTLQLGIHKCSDLNVVTVLLLAN